MQRFLGLTKDEERIQVNTIDMLRISGGYEVSSINGVPIGTILRLEDGKYHWRPYDEEAKLSPVMKKEIELEIQYLNN